MSRETHQRILLYSLAGSLVAGLLWAGFFHKGEPDLGTLIHGADILAKVGAHDKAIQECEKVLERDPGNLQAHLLLAWSQDELGHDAASRLHYRESLRLADRQGLRDLSLEIRLALADLDRRSGRLDEALRGCAEIEEEFGCNQRCSLVQGLAVEAQGRHTEAIELLREAVREGPEDLVPRYYLGMTLRETGLLADAETAFLEAARRDGAANAVWFHLASIRAARGDREGTLAALRRAAVQNRGYTLANVLTEDALAKYLDEAPFREFLTELYGGAPCAL